QRPDRLDVVLLALPEDLAADQSGDQRRLRYRDGYRHVRGVGPQDDDGDDPDEDSGEGQQRVHYLHDQAVDDAARTAEPGQQAQRTPQNDGAQNAPHADEDGDSRAVDDAAGDIATELVGT